MFYRGHPAADQIIESLWKEYMSPAGEDVAKLTQGLSAIYGDLLMDIPSINVAGWHSSKFSYTD